MEDIGKMEFIYQFDNTSPKVVVTLLPHADLGDVLEAFDGFLKAAGYVFDGQLSFVEEEVPSDAT